MDEEHLLNQLREEIKKGKKWIFYIIFESTVFGDCAKIIKIHSYKLHDFLKK